MKNKKKLVGSIMIVTLIIVPLMAVMCWASTAEKSDSENTGLYKGNAEETDMKTEEKDDGFVRLTTVPTVPESEPMESEAEEEAIQYEIADIEKVFGGNDNVAVAIDHDGNYVAKLKRNLGSGVGYIESMPIEIPEKINLTIDLNGYEIVGDKGEANGSAAVNIGDGSALLVTGNGLIKGGDSTSNSGCGGLAVTGMHADLDVIPPAKLQAGSGAL